MKLDRFPVKIGSLLEEIVRLGPRFTAGHIFEMIGGSTKSTTIPGVGKVHVRPGTTDWKVFAQIFRQRQYDISESVQHQVQVDNVRLRIQSAGRVPLIVDAGANNGASAMWFAVNYPGCHIVAIEPDPSNAEICRANTQGRAVDVVEAALGGVRGRVKMSGSEEWGLTAERSESGTTEVVTIDDLLKNYPDSDLLAVKIDIEGFESDVFDGQLEWLDKASLVFLEPHDWMHPGHGSSRSFQREMAKRNFDLLVSGENLVFVRMGE